MSATFRSEESLAKAKNSPHIDLGLDGRSPSFGGRATTPKSDAAATPSVVTPPAATPTSSMSKGLGLMLQTQTTISTLLEASLQPTDVVPPPQRYDWQERSLVDSTKLAVVNSLRDLNYGMHHPGESIRHGWGHRRSFLTKFIRSRLFDSLIGAVITINAATIGCELTYELEGKSTKTLQVLEEVFLCIYVFELGLRIFAEGLATFRCNWVKFDLFLVMVGVVNVWIISIIKVDATQFGFLMVLRMLRLGRLARTVRLLVKFKVLWMLVRGLLSSASTMIYVFLLLSIILYIFSAMGLELITNNRLAETDEEFAAVVREHFATLPDTIMTLVQFLCMDSIGAIYRPLIKKDFTLFFYFTCVILVVPIVLMNLVTAVIVNSALEQASSDKDVAAMYEKEQKSRMIKDLRKVFMNLDADRSGQVSREEVAMIEDTDRFVLRQATDIDDPMELFEALAVDGEDSLGIDDFCDGIWKLATSKVSIEVQRMEKQVAVMFNRLKTVERSQKVTNSKLDLIVGNQALIERALVGLQTRVTRQNLANQGLVSSMPLSPVGQSVSTSDGLAPPAPPAPPASPAPPGVAGAGQDSGAAVARDYRSSRRANTAPALRSSDGSPERQLHRIPEYPAGSASIASTTPPPPPPPPPELPSPPQPSSLEARRFGQPPSAESPPGQVQQPELQDGHGAEGGGGYDSFDLPLASRPRLLV